MATTPKQTDQETESRICSFLADGEAVIDPGIKIFSPERTTLVTRASCCGDSIITVYTD